MTTTNRPRTLITTAPGVARSIHTVAAGDYIWHDGAFRLVTSVVAGYRPVVRMGRRVLRPKYSWTVEAAQ